MYMANAGWDGKRKVPPALTLVRVVVLIGRLSSTPQLREGRWLARTALQNVLCMQKIAPSRSVVSSYATRGERHNMVGEWLEHVAKGGRFEHKLFWQG